MSQDIGIITLGARTAVGLKAHHVAAAVRAGISRRGDHPFMVDQRGQPMMVARDSLLPAELRGVKRVETLAKSAMEEALAPVRPSPRERLSLAAMVAVSEARASLSGLEAESPARWLRDVAPSGLHLTQVEVLPQGHAAGLMALERGWKCLQSGRADLCLVGGVDSYLDAETLESLDARGLLKSPVNRSGFTPGEGAGFCLLASSRVKRHLGLTPLARIASAVTRREEHHFGTQGINVGRGLSDAIAGATSVLGSPPTPLADTMYCDLNGEPHRTEEFTYASLRCQLAFADHSDYVTPSDC